MKAFTLAALPWILAGLAVAIICAGMDKQKSTKKEKEAEERQRQRTDPWNRCRQRTKRYKTHDWSRFSGQRVGWPVNSQGFLQILPFLAELYTMIILKGNPIYLAGFGLVFLIFSYVLMNSVMQLQYQKLREEKAEHEGLLKSEKASYLIIKKSFDEVFQRMDYIEKNLQLPTEELLTAQKAFAKININRSKENADALMNSNDKLLEKIVSFERTLQNNNEKLLDGQNQNMEQRLQEVILRQQELSSSIKELELNMRNEILQAVNSITSSQPQVIMQQPVQPVMENAQPEEPMEEEPVMEEPIIEEPVMEEPIIEEPVMEEPIIKEPVVEEPMIEEPLIEEPVIEEPIMEEPLMEEPIVEESIIEEPLMEEPTIEEPLVEEPLIEEPVAEEPVIQVEEPAEEAEEEEEEVLIPDMSDPNKMMTPDEIAALIANL